MKPLRRTVATVIAASCAFVACLPSWAQTSQSAEIKPLAMQFKNNVVGPREMESQTKETVAREYTRAWQTFSDAFDQNQPTLLSNSFVGDAQADLARGIQDQQRAGIHTKYEIRSHQPQVIFYSPDGLSIIVRDRVTSNIQVMKGGNVLHSADSTQDFISVMTPTANSWRVRILQSVPSSFADSGPAVKGR